MDRLLGHVESRTGRGEKEWCSHVDGKCGFQIQYVYSLLISYDTEKASSHALWVEMNRNEPHIGEQNGRCTQLLLLLIP